MRKNWCVNATDSSFGTYKKSLYRKFIAEKWFKVQFNDKFCVCKLQKIIRKWIECLKFLIKKRFNEVKIKLKLFKYRIFAWIEERNSCYGIYLRFKDILYIEIEDIENEGMRMKFGVVI